MDSKVSFTIRRPTPISRAASSGPDSDAGPSFKVPQLPSHLSTHRHDSPLGRSETSSPHSLTPASVYHDENSSDAESVVEDELVTGFDKFGVQRCVQFSSQGIQLFELTQVLLESSLNGRKKSDKPLVIPALKNKDWRDLARKRRSAAQFVPLSGASQIGKDGSVGGLGTRDVINSGPVLSGLQVKQKKLVENDVVIEETEDTRMVVAEVETDDQVALRAILAETNGSHKQEARAIDAIPTPISEADALKQDVDELPDVATLEDYNRIPVSQFGAAMLRGMGWKEGTAATRKSGRGMVDPYVPVARPALLGIGAKEQEVFDDGSKKTTKSNRPERRYVPIIRQERSNSTSKESSSGRRERSRSPRRSATSSRRSSPDRHNSREAGDRDSNQRRYNNNERYKDSDKRYGDVSQRPRYDERDNRYSSRDQGRENRRKEYMQ
ncbi:DExH-box splicing factor binding site-domain-containing protein [Gymnopilus junonius]|uniref:DExH-box splicing factor binding site-domain-containing protein n=1 Tax=Gymnopilus junonius TaxID=109634 RepID=A0A9P5NRU7_GYMJU|nr:DExH-box splicing factor binding site-domain-containing protein [Gymnopilus junonius]